MGLAYVSCAGELVFWMQNSLECVNDTDGQGDYYFKFDAMTKEKERIYCLETYIHFELKDKDKWLSSS